MSIRHLDLLFEPASVAVIGASTRAGSVGATVWRNLRHGRYAGTCWAVNRRHGTVDGERAYASVAELPAAPDLAVICTPPATVPGLIAELAARGTRAAVVLSAGFTAEQRQQMLDAARTHVLRILGPNCLGLLSPPVGLNASFAHADIEAGSLAFVSQSGALVAAMLDWARGRGIGFSRVVSLGEHADVDFGDLLDWLASDARTRAVLLYVESVSSVRKFMSAARAAARNKPVLLVKVGRSQAGQRAAASHTGALAASDAVFDAAVRRAGMLRVESLQDLFVAAETLAYFRSPGRQADPAAHERVTPVTNGGGAGVLAADAASELGLELATLSRATLDALSAGLPPSWSHGNPVDIIGDAPVERYVHTLATLLAAPESGTLLFMHAPTAIVPAEDIARALVPLVRRHPGRLVSAWLGETAVASARRLFHEAGIPTYDTPEQAVHAIAMLATYRRNQQQLAEAPPAHRNGTCDPARVRTIVDAALAAGREMLTEPEAKELLAACDIPVVPTRTVAPTPEAAAAAASALGFPAVLKILSPQISHKSDVGGVALDLGDAAAVAGAAASMLQRVAVQRPDATIEGFTLQPMVRRPRALELIAGTHVDPLFGPVVLFGAGGTSVEVVADRALALPPLNLPLARATVARTRIARLLAGWRDVPPADVDAVCGVLIALAELMGDEPRIAEVDVNPLLADAQGVLALDARVRVSAAAPGGAERFAIRPYPADLAESFPWTWQGQARTVTMRPIRPEDEAQHLAFLEKMSAEDIRMRIFYSRRSIERSELARLVQIDYEREMAFVATAPSAGGSEETLGVVRSLADPDNADAEFGILVRSDLKGAGIGWRLMNKLIAYQRARGTQRLVATVLRDNRPMLEFCERLGFRPAAQQPDPTARSIEMAL
ncbi:MAG: GNAT family N-acetyltransferase [Pseudomonadota bacterium]|jgi:acetyltransferase|nr:GNAT family N-acetyltransferase [Rubrivivax sp.]MCA3258558.1 GNAT family N-acetyltransferase [Rubrivivax sp.]MCE2913659.1 GNAT family N-acetyltransferase [Rubrivivax sp.]MCZ8031492.1 GNAT family N-acetyltransferase [Rubrivivax sp.]